MSLCRLHNAAFERMILRIRPDYIIRVRAEVLEEVDRTTLQHKLQNWRVSGFWRRRGGWTGRMRGGVCRRVFTTGNHLRDSSPGSKSG